MKETLDRVVVQLDKLDDKIDNVDKTLIKQEENLREHMRRTEILEEQHKLLREEQLAQNQGLKSDVHNELEPIKAHVQQVKGVLKFIVVGLPIAAAAIGALYKLLT